jgi:hypothetical protein
MRTRHVIQVFFSPCTTLTADIRSHTTGCLRHAAVAASGPAKMCSTGQGQRGFQNPLGVSLNFSSEMVLQNCNELKLWLVLQGFLPLL